MDAAQAVQLKKAVSLRMSSGSLMAFGLNPNLVVGSPKNDA